MTCKKPLLVTCKISKLFPNKLTADGKYSLLNWENLTQHIQMQLSLKPKTFYRFFSKFLKSRFNFEHCQKKMALIAEVFPKLRTPKNMVRVISKRSQLKGSFKKQNGKRAKILLKCEWQQIYHIYRSLWRQLIYKKPLLVICKISKLFPNRLSVDGKYTLLNWDNLTQHIQMQLSRKQKAFPEFFSKFLKCGLNF